MGAIYVLFIFYIQYATDLHSKTVTSSESTPRRFTRNCDGSSFCEICSTEYTSAVDSHLAESYSSAAFDPRSVCSAISTPDSLRSYCIEAAWTDVDVDAPWLRA